MGEQLTFDFIDKKPTIEEMLMLVPIYPRPEACCDCNPDLWRWFCEYKGRPYERSDVWAEVDVYEYLINKEKNHV